MFNPESNFVVLYSRNIELTKNFYQLLPIEIIKDQESRFSFTFAGLELHFVEDSTEEIQEYRYNTEGRYGQGFAYYLACTEIEQFHQIVLESKPAKQTRIIDNDWGSREFLFEDPSGYKFVIWEDVD
jgi:predicted enzyme related to lactoylglutathione lyase